MLEQHFVNGLMLGALYGLIAVAFSMVYGILQLVNFAFGEVFMFSAFFAVLLMGANVTGFPVSLPQLPFAIAFLIAVALGALLGVVIERVAFRPLRGAPVYATLISAIAVSMLLRGVAQGLFGAAETPYPDPIGGPAIEIGGVRVQPLNLVILAVAVGATLVNSWIVQRTAIGREMRATTQDREVATLMGVDVNHVVAVTFLISSALAAVAGILYGANFRFAQASMGFLPSLKGLIGAVIGGIGNIQGAFLGGMILGLVESLGAGLVPGGAAYRDAIAFLVLGVVLWIRPQGLLGNRTAWRA